ncbi:MAG: hypothetical protein Q9227_007793 [Pyrenula ochraceoflavens]
MYRNAPLLTTAIPFSPTLTSREPLTASSLEVAEVLGQKRKEVDAEIQNFRARKEQEFRDFERDLRTRAGSSRNTSATVKSTPARSSLLSLITGRTTHPTVHSNVKQEKHDHCDEDRVRVDGRKEPSVATAARSDSPTHVPCATTTRSSDTNKSASRSQPNEARVVPRDDDPLSGRSGTHIDTPGFPPPPQPVPPNKAPNRAFSSHDRDAELRGLFMPHYLSLLDTKHSSLPENSPHHLRSKSDQIPESSRPPIQPSTSLPSAIRRSSSGLKKSKHVLFRLADTAIVEPSSSYEERPSMSSPKEVSPLRQRMLDDNAAGYSTPARALTPPANKASMTASKSDGASYEENDDAMFALDEEFLDDESANRNIPKHEQKKAHSDLDLELEEKHDEMEVGSPAAGSLPIDIVKPRRK